MANGFQWEKRARQERLTHTPSWSAQSATNPQMDYIVLLCRQKAQPIPSPMPKTKESASNAIDRLKALPDVIPNGKPQQPSRITLKPAESPIEDALEERFGLSARQATSLVYLCEQSDVLGASLFFDSLLDGEIEMTEDEDVVGSLMTMFVRWRDGDLTPAA